MEPLWSAGENKTNNPHTSHFMKKRLLILIPACFLVAPALHALINPNFTPVQLVNQSTAVWQSDLVLDEEGHALVATVTATLKGEAPSARHTLDFSDRDHLGDDIRGALTEGKGVGFFLTGDFSGASMDGGEVEEAPWAMVKLGTRWYMVSSGEGGVLRFREDPIDLSTVWAGDPRNLRQVSEYILGDPRADVPVRSGGRWAEERPLGSMEGKVTGIEAVTLAKNPLVMVYREEGDMIFSPAEDFKDITGYMGLQSASVHAAWGRYTAVPAPSLMSINAEGALILWEREGEEFVRRATGVTVEGPTGLSPVARPGQAALLIGSGAGMQLGWINNEATWETLHEFSPPSEAGDAGGVLAVDLTGNGHADLLQSHSRGVHLALAQGDGTFAPRFVSHVDMGTPMSLAAADFDGDGALDLLIGGDRGAVMLLNEGEGAFRENLQNTGELAYNIRPGINAIGTGDHALDGRVDLVLFNHQLPPQIYFNRGFGVFGYDMELDLIEDAPDAQFAAGEGQQAGLLADVTGNGLQELLMVTTGGEFWLLTRDAEATAPLGATLVLPPTVTGPVPVVLREGQRTLGARIASPHAPAHIGRRNRGPVMVSWRHPGSETVHEQRVIVLRPEAHTLETE
jgi:hypothetical protein